MSPSIHAEPGHLRPITAGVAVIDYPHSVAGLALGGRTTVVSLSGGGLLLYSPGPLDARLCSEIEARGEVRALFAPSLQHHLFLAENRRAFPSAAIYGVTGLPAREPAILFDGLCGDESPWPELTTIAIRGMPRLNEVVLFHPPSKTLITADLAFNLQHVQGWFTRVIMRLNGGYGHLQPTRLFRALIRDREAMRASVDRVLALDFERLIVAHGEIVEADGQKALRRAYAWLRPPKTISPVGVPVRV